MTRYISSTLAVAALVAVLLHPALLSAQDLDILAQSVNGQLVTGTADFDDDPTSPEVQLGARVHARSFDDLFSLDEPGFNSIASTTGSLPPGVEELPPGVELRWDFLPMKVNSYAANLLYWNGAGTTINQVAFGPAPTPDYSLSLFGDSNERASADGTAALVAGHSIGTTGAGGFLHAHRFFFLDNDHDDGNATVAAEGVYLIAMRLRAKGLDRSEPFYLLFGTPETPLAALDAAEGWVGSQVDKLAPHFAADYDGDLDVDGADYLTWQRGLGLSGTPFQVQGDGNGDDQVDALDLASWRSQFGMNLSTFPGAPNSSTWASIPEPGGEVLALAALVALIGRAHRL